VTPLTPSKTAGVLGALRDIAGVEGSFLLSGEGHLVARDMPGIFGDDVLDEAGPRLMRLGETFSVSGGELHSYLVRYSEHLLFLRPVSGGAVCVLSLPEVNMPALRMGINLAARRLAALLSDPAPMDEEPLEATSDPAPAMQWRGAVVPRKP